MLTTLNIEVATKKPVVYVLTPKVRVNYSNLFESNTLFEAGASVAQVQERMRHQNPEITLKIYKHVTNTMKKDTATIFKEHLENN